MASQPEPTVVLLGNPNPQMQVLVPRVENDQVVGRDQISVPAKHLNQSVTRLEMRPDFDDPEHVELTLSTDNDRLLHMISRALGPEHRAYAVGVAEVEQVISVHHAGDAPTWVDSPDEGFAKAIAHFYGCPVGEPTALLTNSGRDMLHAQHLSTSAQPASCNYLGLANSATATTPAAGDTTLAGEITTGGGGLIRAQATYAHTAGTNTSTLTKTFTANGSDSLPVTVSQAAAFNASSAGTMGYKAALNANATLTISGDNVTVTYTINVG